MKLFKTGCLFFMALMVGCSQFGQESEDDLSSDTDGEIEYPSLVEWDNSFCIKDVGCFIQNGEILEEVIPDCEWDYPVTIDIPEDFCNEEPFMLNETFCSLNNGGGVVCWAKFVVPEDVDLHYVYLELHPQCTFSGVSTEALWSKQSEFCQEAPSNPDTQMFEETFCFENSLICYGSRDGDWASRVYPECRFDISLYDHITIDEYCNL